MAVRTIAMALALAACTSGPPSPMPAAEPQWQSIFNGHDLDGWTPKFTHHPLGENIHNTFRVEDGVLKVRYDGYSELSTQFGHLFYRTPYSHYRIRLEYRFLGEQVAGAPSWALRNTGIMIHSQPPETMELDQEFPDSIEVQLLGSDGVTPRTTANMCSPQSSIVLNGRREVEHCITSNAPSPPPEQWGNIEVEVRGNQVIRHIVNGQVAMEYSEPTLDEPRPWAPNVEMTSGYIALQAESHPAEFRNIEIMVLE